MPFLLFATLLRNAQFSGTSEQNTKKEGGKKSFVTITIDAVEASTTPTEKTAAQAAEAITTQDEAASNAWKTTTLKYDSTDKNKLVDGQDDVAATVAGLVQTWIQSESDYGTVFTVAAAASNALEINSTDATNIKAKVNLVITKTGAAPADTATVTVTITAVENTATNL